MAELKRAVITGIGIVSCLGNDKASVTDSLRQARSGIRYREIYKDMGMRSHVGAAPDIDLKAAIDRKQFRFMGGAAAYAYLAMHQAISDAGLTEAEVSNVYAELALIALPRQWVVRYLPVLPRRLKSKVSITPYRRHAPPVHTASATH